MNGQEQRMVKVGHSIEDGEIFPIFQDLEDLEDGQYSSDVPTWTWDPDGPPGLLCSCGPPWPELD